ncbi:hypothetical protein LUZ60_015841 [Juncus effusus]|nr:hypothetical protein LUZ60_015841 [Juncus effusus]
MESPPPPTEELLKKIQELEADQAILKQEMSKLILPKEDSFSSPRRSQSVSPRRPPRRRNGGFESGSLRGSASFGPATSSRLKNERGDPPGSGTHLSDRQCLRVLEFMGQSVHILDLQGRIIFWNRSAEKLYGFTVSEALGNNAINLLTHSQNSETANKILSRIKAGASWTGKLPVKNKYGETFLSVSTNTPFYDDDGSLIGVICVSSDLRSFDDELVEENVENCEKVQESRGFTGSRGGFLENSSQNGSSNFASKLSTLATKVTKKVCSRMNNTDRDASPSTRDCECTDLEAASHEQKDESTPTTSNNNNTKLTTNNTKLTTNTNNNNNNNNSEDSNEKTGLHKMISSKAEALLAKKGINWPWKVNESDVKNKFVWPWLQNNESEPDSTRLTGPDPNTNPNPTHVSVNENQGGENIKPHVNNVHSHTGSWCSSFNANSANSSVSSSGSTNGSAVNKVDLEVDCLDYEILWEDLTIGEQVGQGSSGTVYHALWYGSDVAVKVFSKQEYSEEVILSFRQEVSLMKRLRHPNILLFMGAVTSPQRLCIVTEYLPRGCLLRLLQKNNIRLDWRRRIHMALDIARGLNYLHHYSPPIVHRDLKSSNLLVDKNWTVKVADFGLSRLKRQSFLTTKSGNGTPQWMAPEVLRNEPSDEKSDVYSYGVILWELVTQKIPWENLNSIQVIGAVGFMNQRLELPSDVDPQWASIVYSCWDSEPQKRPSFQELVEKMRDLLRQHTMQHQLQRSTSGDPTEKAAAKNNVHD